ncbi:MAG: hypothetical protein C5B43_03000 [Verrucomicrobia bacterium]|nr:MAG: hypothetical protein C5B43_03000 [Verrucomicrobiota bacterium]
MKNLSNLDKLNTNLILPNSQLNSNGATFRGLQMAVCTSPGKRDEDADDEDLFFLGKSLQDYQVEKFIVMHYDSNSYEDLIGSYFSCFAPELMEEHNCYPILMRLAWKEDNDNGDINATRIGFHNPFIFQRLKKMNLLTEKFIKERWGFYISLLSNGPFVIADKLGWMMKDKEIEEKFEKISRIIKLLLQHEKNTIEQLKKFFPQYDIEVVKPDIIRSYEPSKDQKQKKLTIINNTPLNTSKIDERLKLKGNAISVIREKERRDKEEVLKRLDDNQRILSTQDICKIFYPCKLTAYLFFEEVLNHACSAAFSSFENNYFKNVIQAHQAYVAVILIEVLDLLYPHVEEIPKAFGFDLEKDILIEKLWEIQEVYSDILEKEKAEYEAYEQQIQQLKQKKLENSKQATKAPVIKVNTNNNNANLENIPETKSQEHIIQENIADKKSEDLIEEQTRNVETVQKEEKTEKTNNSKIKKEEANLEKQTKKEEKEKRLQERNAERAAQIFTQHKIEQDEEEKAKEIKRMERIKKIHDLPSPNFVEEKIVSVFRKKKGGNADNFKKVFAELHNNRTLNKDQTLSLAFYIYEHILKANNIGCAEDFYNEVCVRAHYRHTDGHNFPTHYVDILRSTFVIFGIFPKDWKPQTKEDFDAMNKYLQRTIDKLLYQKKTVRGNIENLLAAKEKIETALKNTNNTNNSG